MSLRPWLRPRLLHPALAAALLAGCSSSRHGDDGDPALDDAGFGDGDGDGDSDGQRDGGSAPSDRDAEAPPPRTLAYWADLRADVNRDGRVSLDGAQDDEGEDTWSATAGAVMLANLDDDEQRCPDDGSDDALAGCHDAADEVVNGQDDLADLARIHIAPRPDAPDGIVAELSLGEAAERVRLFRKQGDDFVLLDSNHTFASADLRAGVELAIEARDIVRDLTVWDGYVDVQLSAELAGESSVDRVRMRVAPVLTYHHLLPASEAFASDTQSSDGVSFLRDLNAASEAAGVPRGLTRIDTYDQWAQDYFETGYMSMPTEGGAQHVIEVAFRASNQYRGLPGELREAGRFVYTEFRGKDRAGLTQRSSEALREADSLNSYGNLETIPPYSHDGESYPFGRILRGSTETFYPDPSLQTLLDSQLQQPTIKLDTSWLSVGHVDETVSFVKAHTPRGWVMLINDPRLARTMLEEQVELGHGKAKLFVGMRASGWLGGSAEISIDDLLADTEVMAESAKAAAAVDKQREILVRETGLTDSEIVRVPYLHMPSGGGSVAYQPGTLNGIYLSDGVFAAPDPHGPVIDGKDIFKKQLEDALAPHGITVKWVEDWDLYHIQSGEVHCGSNAVRSTPETKWWESGR